jgi:hypothetical protein
MAARLGQTEIARRYFRQAAEIDLANNMGNAALGVHAGGLGALWQAAVLGFAGFQPNPDRLTLDPRPPPDWRMIDFRLRWRGRTVRVRLSGEAEVATAAQLSQDAALHSSAAGEVGESGAAAERGEEGQLMIELDLEEGDPMHVQLHAGAEVLLEQGQPQCAIRDGDGWGGWSPIGATVHGQQE